jgi:hypothetical protein
MTALASSLGVLALQPQQHHYPRLPSQRHCPSHCFDDPNQTLRQLLIPSRLGSPHRHFRRPRQRCRDSLEPHRRLRRGLHLEGRLQVSLRTVKMYC